MMYLTDKCYFIGNEKVDSKIKGFNVAIKHYCTSNKSYLQYKVDTGKWVDDIGTKMFSVVPRAVMAHASYSVLVRGFNDRVEIYEMSNNGNSECDNCPYSEDCNGQMCFFAEV